MLALAKEFGKEYVKAGFSMAKNFAIIGGIYQCSECGLEKLRAKTDLYNRCVTCLSRFDVGLPVTHSCPVQWLGVSLERFWRETLVDQVWVPPMLPCARLPRACNP
jgi:hypothetical protein